MPLALLQPQAITLSFFCFQHVCNVHIYISTYINVQ
jgi:hypothetical protein